MPGLHDVLALVGVELALHGVLADSAFALALASMRSEAMPRAFVDRRKVGA
jgi:hypothetical protein